jgi:biopolymer transport protein TolR
VQQNRPRANRLICNIDVTAFAGVMFVLVYLFMSPQVDFPGRAPVDLAKADYAVPMRGADREDAMVIGVTRDGKIFFGTDAVVPNQLPAKIRDSVNRGAERKVYIRADARAKYARVAEVLDSVHVSGIERIGFLVDSRQATPVTPQ